MYERQRRLRAIGGTCEAAGMNELLLQLLMALLSLVTATGGGSAPLTVIGLDQSGSSAQGEPFVEEFWTNGQAGVAGHDDYPCPAPVPQETTSAGFTRYTWTFPYPEEVSDQAEAYGAWRTCYLSVSHCPGSERPDNFDENGEPHGRTCVDPRCPVWWGYSPPDGVDCGRDLWVRHYYPVTVWFLP